MFFAPKPPKPMTDSNAPTTPTAPTAPLSFAKPMPASQPTPSIQPPMPSMQPEPAMTASVDTLPETSNFPEPVSEDAFSTPLQEPTTPIQPNISKTIFTEPQQNQPESIETEPTPALFSPSTPPPIFEKEEDAPLLDDPVFGMTNNVFEEETLGNPLDVMPEYETPAPIMDTAKPTSAFAPPIDYEEEKTEQNLPQLATEKEYFEPYVEKTENGKVFRARSLCDVPFADIWYTPENIAYVRDKDTKFALIPIETEDLADFKKALEEGYTGSSSYALKFFGESYRVERVMTITGVQYNCRKMPTETPDIYTLGLPKTTIDYLVGLSQEAGLILLGGPTGMGKTTTASALLHKYLENDGGFMYTVEDPPEMPLDGLYHAKNGGLGLCKQTPVENERWEDGLKSALRSKPRYILVGEIRTPEVASQALRAATSGHLVISTIHANSVEDALNSMIKYASGAGLAESLVADLLARGILAVVHQKLEGTTQLRPVIHTCFANPNPLAADQMRMAIREGKINLATLMEAQSTKLMQGRPLYREL